MSATPNTPKQGLPSICPNMHPTRMAQVADLIARRPDVSEEVQTLAAIVRELCHQVDSARDMAQSAKNSARRGF